MDKKYGIAAAITMLIGSGYIIYTDIWMPEAVVIDQRTSEGTVVEEMVASEETSFEEIVATGTITQKASTVSLVDYKAEGPATIDLAYTGLTVGQEYGVTICLRTGGCTEWVETFTPATANGIYQMDMRHRSPTSQKGLGSGEIRLMLFREGFGQNAVYSDYFIVPE